MRSIEMRSVPIIMFLFLCAFAPAAGASSECLVCHGAMQGKLEGPKGPIELRVDSVEFSSSVHGGLECTGCHITFTTGHAGAKAKSEPAVNALVPFTALKSKADPVALAACVKCHQDIYSELRASVHGKNIFEKKSSDGPLCLDCHGNPHYILPKSNPKSAVYHLNKLESCGKCHEKEEFGAKYSFSPHVIEKYKESFHGKKYILGHMRVPVCDDCHGAHNVTAVLDPGSPVSGEGKRQTCGKCHKGATAKFAAAPAHKYIGKDNPIPYYGEKLLIVLVFGVFAFTISHVLLESWAEIRDNIFRKKKGGRHE